LNEGIGSYFDVILGLVIFILGIGFLFTIPLCPKTFLNFCFKNSTEIFLVSSVFIGCGLYLIAMHRTTVKKEGCE